MQSTKIPVKYIDTNKYVIVAECDEFAENPAEWGNFYIVTFGRGGLITDTDRDTYMQDNPVDKWLKDGKAFYIDVYRHGNTVYSLSGDGVQDKFDTAQKAGLIVFQDEYVDGVPYDDRRGYAVGDLETYTAWANGEVYNITIKRDTGLVVDEIGGLYGDGMITCIEDELGKDTEYEIVYK